MDKLLKLVNPPIDFGYINSIRTGVYPPLSLASLTGYIKQNNPDIEIEIMDGQLLSLQEIIEKSIPIIVGISCNVLNYHSALAIAQELSSENAKIIFGGPYTNYMGRRIIKNRPFIDAVVVGDGEISLSLYLNETPKELIPNLIYRKNGEITENPIHEINLNEVHLPDYCNLPLKTYFQNYKERYGDFKPFNGTLATYSRKGCIWREKSNGGCVFCMIPHSGMRYRKPENVWKEISHFNNVYGVDHFWEVCDTFTEDDQWIQEFIRKRPNNIDVSFQIYGRPNHISARMARQLKELNVHEVFIGAESGDDEILKNSNKGCKVYHTRRTIEVLAKEGIYTIVSFVFGLPGETSKTLQKTIDLARELSRCENVIETSSSVLLPIPGSISFDMLMRYPGMKEKHSSDLLDLEELKRDWAKFCTNVSYDEIVAAKEEAVALFPLNSTFSQYGKESAPQC